MTRAAPTEYRLELCNTGYEPLPVNGKAPVMDGWQEHIATADEIRLWPKQYKGAHNTGSLTRKMPTFDCDIKNETAAAVVEGMLREKFKPRGKMLIRIGQAPKFAVPFRTATPFAKYAVSLIGPDGSSEHKIEMLGNGQQVLVDGIHKDTGKPYEWRGGRPGKEVPWNGLPEINEEEAHALVDAAVSLLIAEHGFHLATRDGKGKASETDLIINVLEGAALHDALRDLAAKHIVRGEPDEDVEAILRGLMERSDAPRDKRWQERYDSIPRLVKSAAKKVETGKWKTGSDDFRFELLPGASLVPRQQEWLWLGHIPRGTLSLLVGLPDVGKSHIFVDLCARITTGRNMPLSDIPMLPQDVLIVCTEDRVEHTLVPRLIAAGADMARVTFLRYLRTSKGERRGLDLTQDETTPGQRPTPGAAEALSRPSTSWPRILPTRSGCPARHGA